MISYLKIQGQRENYSLFRSKNDKGKKSKENQFLIQKVLYLRSIYISVKFISCRTKGFQKSAT